MSDSFSRRGCRKRHDGICLMLGTHDSLCPDTEPSLVPRDKNGRVVKGASLNKHGLKSLRSLRRRMREELDGGEELLHHMLVLAGLRPGPGGVFDVKTSDQVRVTLRLSELLWGRDIKVGVEHSGTVTHDATLRAAPDFSSLTVEEHRTLHAISAKLQARDKNEGVEDAVIVPDDEKEEG